jgi:hypothetical protein
MTFVPFLSLPHTYLKFINFVQPLLLVVTTLQKVLEDKKIGLTFHFHLQFFRIFNKAVVGFISKGNETLKMNHSLFRANFESSQ